MTTTPTDITHQQILDHIDVSHQRLLDHLDATRDELHGAMTATRDELLGAMTDQLSVITDNMVTRQDVEEIVEEIVEAKTKHFATKDDLEAFATKDDLKKETADIRDEQLRQGILLEALDADVKAIAESVSSELKLTRRLNDHDNRITTLETKGKIITSTVTHNSREIKKLQAAH